MQPYFRKLSLAEVEKGGKKPIYTRTDSNTARRKSKAIYHHRGAGISYK